MNPKQREGIIPMIPEIDAAIWNEYGNARTINTKYISWQVIENRRDYPLLGKYSGSYIRGAITEFCKIAEYVMVSDGGGDARGKVFDRTTQ